MTGLKITCADCGQVNRVPPERLEAGPKCGICGARLVDGKVRGWRRRPNRTTSRWSWISGPPGADPAA